MTEVFNQVLDMQAITYPQACYYCGEEIKTVEEATYLPVFLEKVKKVKGKSKKEKVPMLRACHHHCEAEIKKAMQADHSAEVEYRKKIFDKLKELLDIQGTVPKYLVTRVDGLRQGRTYSRGQNTYITNRGYSFELIYTTLIFSYAEIQGMMMKGEFKDLNHKINSVMYVVQKHIDVVKLKVKKRNIEAEKLSNFIDKIQTEHREEIAFDPSIFTTSNSKEKDSFIASLKDDGETVDMDDLFEG